MKRLAAVLLLITGSLRAQQPAAAGGDDHQLILQLLARVQELEAEVKRLKAEPGPVALAPGAAPAVAAPAVAGPAPAVAALTPPVTGTSAPGSMDMGMPGMHDLPVTGGPTLQFRGFSDVGFNVSDQKGTHSTFSDGAFNLFMTSKISEKFSALAELVFEFDPLNGVHPDLERMLLRWDANDYFNLTAGRFHTSIGYYNTAYHHASWLQTTVNRPFLFAFEDAGGILPTHNVGLSAGGLIPSGGAGLHWIAEIGNGRRSSSTSNNVIEQVQQSQDENSRKSYTLALYARPAALRGFQTGFSVYKDRLYITGQQPVDETIWDAYATYHPAGFEMTAEAVGMFNHVRPTATLKTDITYKSPGYYYLISKQYRKYRPYFSWEHVNVPQKDPAFGTVGRRGGPSTGLRYDFSEYAAFKLEYFRLMRSHQVDVNGLRTQLTFTF